jgi:hypothetical protein
MHLLRIWGMKNVREYSWTMILALALFAPAAWAQQPDPRVNPPIPPDQLAPAPAGKALPSLGPAGEPATELEKEVIPDTRPLSGAEQFTLGQMGKARNYLLPSFESFETIDTNPLIAGTKSDIISATSLIGRIALQRVWSRYRFTADYKGGGILYTPQSELNTTVHDFRFTQRINSRRWSLLLSDQLRYFPESSFGYGGYYSGQSSLGASFDPTFQSSQSIFTVRSTRLGNTAVGQVEYIVSKKSQLTATASYDTLRFEQAGFLDSSNVALRAGYSYNPTPRNTLALSYGFSLFRFGKTTQQVHDQNVHLAYGRRITGRLALELSAGPDIYTFKNPLAGSARQLTWSLDSALTYRFPKTDLRMAYTSYLTGGAGVLPGARSDEVRLTATSKLSRNLSSSLDLGYARNAVLQQTTNVTGNPAINTWFAGVQLTRPLGRYTNVYLDYYFQRQTSDIALCAVSICGGPTTLRHHFGIGFDWHRRPIPLG